MNRLLYLVASFAIFTFAVSFRQYDPPTAYGEHYREKLENFKLRQEKLERAIEMADLQSQNGIETVRMKLKDARKALKAVDFWLRYLEPIAYKQINGPLAVEWETEVFEKFEAPYRREGAGLTLAELYLDEPQISKDSLLQLIRLSRTATDVFTADSVTTRLNTYHNFFLCNRLFLLNLAAIYTTGFECPSPEEIIPELQVMMASVNEIYRAYEHTFPEYPLEDAYVRLFDQAVSYLHSQGPDRDEFDHFEFIQKYVNPLFGLNQKMIQKYQVVSGSYNDYSLSNTSPSIFDKSLFTGQNPKGVFYAIEDERLLNEIKQTGKLLFYDPLLSGNVKRSCASCHKPTEYFTDTTAATSVQFNERDRLKRNTPTLINVVYNHLVNQDGKHFNLQNQAKDVLTNPEEMAGIEPDLLKRVLSCGVYRTAFKKYSALTPYSKRISLDHITSSLTLYYSDFSQFYSPFDEAMNAAAPVHEEVKKGFNLFMGKAACGTCHFVPHFNGVKPPFTSSEFEVLGTPKDKAFGSVSPDSGRFLVHPAKETYTAFRTGTIRNTASTKPYMHNGIFGTLEEVIDFYDAGGGAGQGLQVTNQTLASDSLKLTVSEKKALLTFIHSLSEKITLPAPPAKLPDSNDKLLKNRKVGGEY